jgi:hypothetical protein
LTLRCRSESTVPKHYFIFPEGIYYKGGIIGTTKIATIFEVLRDKNIEKSTMVP